MAKLKLCGDDGWYTIERAEHDGREWLEPLGPGASRYMRSSRISDADVEGTLEEMQGIAKAIRARGTEAHKRCAVDATGDEVRFWSPRNSQRDGVSSIADALDLATQIEAAVTRP